MKRSRQMNGEGRWSVCKGKISIGKFPFVLEQTLIGFISSNGNKTNKQKKKKRFSDMINQDIPYYTGCSRMEEFTSYLKYVDKIII